MPQHSLQQYPIPTESLAAAQEAAAFIATQLTTVLIDQAHNSIKNSSILYSNSTYSATAPTTTSSTPTATTPARACSPCTACKSTSECTACQTGYGIDSSKLCSLCQASNCLACSTVDVCTRCKNGFYLLSGVCQSCVWPCAFCTCAAGTYISGTSCLNCPSGCATCSSSTKCLTCTTRAAPVSGVCQWV